MPYKLLGHVLNRPCVVIRMSGSKVAGSRWRAVGVAGEQQGRLVKLSEHRMVILILCSATQHRSLAVKKSIFFDSVSMSLTFFSEI